MIAIVERLHGTFRYMHNWIFLIVGEMFDKYILEKILSRTRLLLLLLWDE